MSCVSVGGGGMGTAVLAEELVRRPTPNAHHRTKNALTTGPTFSARRKREGGRERGREREGKKKRKREKVCGVNERVSERDSEGASIIFLSLPTLILSLSLSPSYEQVPAKSE